MMSENKDEILAMDKEAYGQIGEEGQTDSLEQDMSGQMKNQPKLIISSYDLRPKMVEAGEDFNLAITLYNTNNENTIYNLKVSLDQNLQSQPGLASENSNLVSDGSVFSPVDSSNTFYTSAIYPWNYVTKDIKMHVLPNAKAGAYVMGVTMEYEDQQGNQYTSTESIGIPVVQKAQISPGEVNIDEDLVVGMPASVSMDVYNTGKDDLSTFMLEVEGDGFTTDEGSRFIGNFSPGSTENYSFTITPDTEGPIEGKIIMTYEDSTGREHKEEKTFKKQVAEGEKDQILDENGEPLPTDPETGEPITEENGDGQGGFLTSPATWIGLVVLIVAIILLMKHRKNKKKDEEELTIDED